MIKPVSQECFDSQDRRCLVSQRAFPAVVALFAITTCLFPCAVSLAAEEVPARPNIVLILTGDKHGQGCNNASDVREIETFYEKRLIF